MRSVRYRVILLAVAGLFAATHAVGVLFGTPVWRFAELASLGALLAYAIASGLPAPRWILPTALTALLVNAVLTLPAAPDPSTTYGWQILTTSDGFDMTTGLESALAAWWAPLVVVALLLIRWRPSPRPSLAALLITGYAVFRVTDIGLAARGRSNLAEVVTAASLAVLPPLALGLAAVALTAALARNGRRLAAAGASLLALVALPHIDSAIEATPLPYGVRHHPGLFGWDLIPPTLSTPQPMPALTTALTLTAFLLLVAGLTRPARADTVTAS